MKWPVTITQDKPFLDEETFQQLLAASYTLQQHADRLLANEARTDCARTLSVGTITEPVGPIQALPEIRETVAHPVTLMEPVLPVAQAVQKQADRLVANEARTDHVQTLSAGANAERGSMQIPPETHEAVAPVSLMEPVLPVPQADVELSQPLNNPQIRPAVMALIAEINGLLEGKED